MKKTKKAIASLAIAGMALTMIPFNVLAASAVDRLAGVTAEQTAVQIADQTGWTGKAILASSTSYGMVDALTAGPLASYLQAPILLTGAGNVLDASTKAELTKLAVTTVYVTSGTAVISQGVLDELAAMNITVVKLGGVDRAATSVNIAQKMVGVTKVAIANSVQDALSIAAIASAANQPILLTDKDALPASVAAYLAANPGITSSDVIGGTGIISEAVKLAAPNATRHAGNSAYDTNNQVIQDLASSLLFSQVYLANGATGIDALAGAPLAAKTKSAIVLTDGVNTPAAAAFVSGKMTSTSQVTALGGSSVVPETQRNLGYVAPAGLQLSSVSAINANQISLVFNQPVTNAGDTIFSSNTKILTSNITITPIGTASAVTGNLLGKLSDDKTTLTVSLSSASDKFNGTYAVSVVKDSIIALNNATIKVAVSNTTFVADDKTKPVVSSVTYDTTEATVNFSEPLKTEGTVSLDGVQLISGTDYTFTAPSNKLELLKLKAGTTYSLAITGATDANSNFMASNPTVISLVVVADSAAPTVDVTASNKTFSFKFNEKLQLQDLGSGTAIDYAKLTITPIGGGATVVYLKAANQDANDKTLFTYDASGIVSATFGTVNIKVEGFKDKAGNTGTAVTKNGVLLTSDTTKPVFESAFVSNNMIIAKFNEDVDVTGGPTTLAVRYTSKDGVLDTSNTTLTVTSANSYDVNGDGTIQSDEKNYVAFTVSGPAAFLNSSKLVAGTYEVTIPAANLIDQGNNNTASAVRTTLTVTSSTSSAVVELSSATQVASAPGTFEVKFNNNLSNTGLTYSNYALDGVTIPSASKVYFYGDKKTVRIELPASWVAVSGNRTLSVANLTDTDGNSLKSSASTTVINALLENVKATTTKVELLDPQNIRVTFSENLGTLPTVSGVKVKVNGAEITLDATTPFTLGSGSDLNKVTIKALATAAFKTTDTISVEFTSCNIVDLNGNKVADGTVSK